MEANEVISKHLMQTIIREWLTQKRQEQGELGQYIIDELLEELQEC